MLNFYEVIDMVFSKALINNIILTISKQALELIKGGKQKFFKTMQICLQKIKKDNDNIAKKTILKLSKEDFKDFILLCIDQSINWDWGYTGPILNPVVKSSFMNGIIHKLNPSTADGLVKAELIAKLLDVVNKVEEINPDDEVPEELPKQFKTSFKAIYKFLNKSDPKDIKTKASQSPGESSLCLNSLKAKS